MATNAARYRMVAGKHIKLLEFGLRRAQGPDGGLSASKYSYIGKFIFELFKSISSAFTICIGGCMLQLFTLETTTPVNLCA